MGRFPGQTCIRARLASARAADITAPTTFQHRPLMAEEIRTDQPGEAVGFSPPSADGPATETAGGLKSALSGFIAARKELLAIEAKEAAGFAAKKATLAVVLALCGFFVWCLVLVAVTGIAAPLADSLISGGVDWLPGWCAVLLALALLHALAALVCVLLLRKKPADPLFALSRRELENDKQWLKKNN